MTRLGLVLSSILLAIAPAAAGTPALVVVADGATAAERTAARELAGYLHRVLDRRIRVVPERRYRAGDPAFLVGPTRAAEALGIETGALGPEEWILRGDAEALVLAGGRPRGTLYAVYRFLEDEVGVRWWTPFEETVPRRDRLRLRPTDRRGRPAFVYRDIGTVVGPPVFAARNRLNGTSTGLGPAYGGRNAFGPPNHVHTFYFYARPAELFDTHPEYFSEIAGLRYRGEGQLCLTNDALFRYVLSRIRELIERSRRSAAERGEPPPRLFDLSQNDWGKPCQCDACSRFVSREGQSGLLIDFVNRVADALRPDYPGIALTTLAYGYTIDPPATVRPRDNVIVRFAGLYGRNFAHGIAHPDNSAVLEALEGWSRIAPRLWVWDYGVNFGEPPESPLDNYLRFADDYRVYRSLGIEGAYVQLDYPIRGDMRDLKLWVLAKVLEDPARDTSALVREFTDGFYGKAGGPIRKYVGLLGLFEGRHPSLVEFHSGPEAYAHLTPEFLRRAQALFDSAERAVRDDPVLSRRVRRARMSLDLATIARSGRTVEMAGVIERYRRAWEERVESTYPPRLWPEKKAALSDALEEALED